MYRHLHRQSLLGPAEHKASQRLIERRAFLMSGNIRLIRRGDRLVGERKRGSLSAEWKAPCPWTFRLVYYWPKVQDNSSNNLRR